MPLRPLAIAILLGATTSCAVMDAPMSEISVRPRQYSNQYVLVTPHDIDGRDVTANPSANEVITPGMHTLRFGDVTTTMNAQPCTRYYFGLQRLQRENAQGQRQAGWRIVVTDSEPVGDCDPEKVLRRFGMTPADLKPGPVLPEVIGWCDSKTQGHCG